MSFENENATCHEETAKPLKAMSDTQKDVLSVCELKQPTKIDTTDTSQIKMQFTDFTATEKCINPFQVAD